MRVDKSYHPVRFSRIHFTNIKHTHKHILYMYKYTIYKHKWRQTYIVLRCFESFYTYVLIACSKTHRILIIAVNVFDFLLAIVSVSACVCVCVKLETCCQNDNKSRAHKWNTWKCTIKIYIYHRHTSYKITLLNIYVCVCVSVCVRVLQNILQYIA